MAVIGRKGEGGKNHEQSSNVNGRASRIVVQVFNPSTGKGETKAGRSLS